MYVSLQIMLKFTFYKYQNWQYIQCMINDNWYIDYQLLKNKYSSWTAVQYYSFITLDNQYVIWSVLAAEVCASAVVMLDTQCSEVVWRVLDTHSIHQFPLHFPSRASPCAITLQLESSNAGYTMFQGSVKSTGYPLHSPVSPSLPLPCVTVCHHISTGLYQLSNSYRTWRHWGPGRQKKFEKKLIKSQNISDRATLPEVKTFNPLNPELNPICYLLALLGAHHFLHVSRIRVKLLTFSLLMS